MAMKSYRFALCYTGLAFEKASTEYTKLIHDKSSLVKNKADYILQFTPTNKVYIQIYKDVNM